jgi:C-terminal processing protease CtpA/Prc
MKKNSEPWVVALVLVAVFVWPALTGCVVNPVTWTGSVDAVFKYQTKKKSTVVYKVRPESFSEEAGLKEKDVLLAVDGHDLSNSSYEMVRAALRGPVGTIAKVTVKRGEEIVELGIERKPVKTESEDDDKDK